MLISNQKIINDCKLQLSNISGEKDALQALLIRFENSFGFEDDENGEFTADDLRKVAEWDYKDFSGLLDFIESIWWRPDWGFVKNEMPGGWWIELHTGGWSGNEKIIDALKQNYMFWAMCWVKSERGGHFYFRLKN